MAKAVKIGNVQISASKLPANQTASGSKSTSVASSANTPTAVDQNYFLQAGESSTAYNQRIAAYNAGKSTENTATPTQTSMNARITSTPDKKVSAPVVVTSDAAKADLAHKRAQIDTLKQDAAAQKAGKASSIDQNYFMQAGETPDAYNERIDQYRQENPNASSMDDQINELLGAASTEQEPAANLSPAEQQMQDVNAEQVRVDQQMQKEFDATNKALDQIRAGTYPLTASEHSLLDSTQQMFQSIIAAQETANTAYSGQVDEANASLGISTSAPQQAAGMAHLAVTVGAAKVADLDAKMASSLADLEQGFMDNDYKMVMDQWNTTSGFLKERATALSTLHDSLQGVIDKMHTSQQDTAIAGLVSGGATDPALVLKTLNSMGYTTTLEDVSKSMKSISEATITPDIITSTDGRGNTFGINKTTGEILWKAAGTSKASATGNTGDYTFTTTQLNKGAANAGVSLDDFKNMDPDSQNVFINGDIKGTKKSIDDELTGGTSIDDVVSSIEDMDLPPDAEQFLIDYANGGAEDSESPTPEETESTFEDTLKDLQKQGYKRDEAYKEVLNELTDNGKSNMPSFQQSALRSAQDTVYGKIIDQNLNAWDPNSAWPLVK